MGNPVSDNEVMQVAFERWGIKLKKTARDEFSGPCPVCGGRDRFVVFQNDSGYWCRQCGKKGWLDDNKEKFVPDPKWIELQKERERLERERRAELLKAWQAGHAVGYWQGRHDAMLEHHRQWWNGQGIADWQIDFYALGYEPNKKVKTPQGDFVIGAYSIPIRSNDTWDVVGIHWRLERDIAGIGKYRYEDGVPVQPFYSDYLPEGETRIIVEGAKKAMVLRDRLCGEMNPDAIQFIGLPSVNPSEFVLDEIAKWKFEHTYILLDPDGQKHAPRIAHKIPRAKIVSLPAKPDDCFTQYGMTKKQFNQYLYQGTMI